MIGSVTVGWVLFICAGSVVYCVVAYSDSNEVLCTCTHTVRFSVCVTCNFKKKSYVNMRKKALRRMSWSLIICHMSFLIMT